MDEAQLDMFGMLGGSKAPPTIDPLLTPEQIFEAEDQELYCRLTEDDRFDRKSSKIQAKDLGPVLSAMSNGPSVKGGVVVIGIDNKCRLEGCSSMSEDRLQAIEAAAAVYCPAARVNQKRIRITKENGKVDFLILMLVKYSHERLIELSDGRAFERIADSSKEIDDVRKQQIRIDKGERSFELEVVNLAYPADFDTDSIEKFCRKIIATRGLTSEHTNESILESFFLGRRTQGQFLPNNACALLFAKDPRYVFPGAYIHFLRYSGIDEGSGAEYNVQKDVQLSGNIGSIILAAAALVEANIREFTIWVEGRFQSSAEYPKDAWYELIVNACVHRSYMMKSVPTFIKMFDDRIVFQSPGGFMPGVNPANIYDRHHPRNPFIMRALRETGEVRCVNEGTKRIRREMERAKLPAPLFSEDRGDSARVTAVLRNNASLRHGPLGGRVVAAIGAELATTLDPEEVAILNHAMEKGRVNVTDAMAVLRTGKWHFTKLKLDRLVAAKFLTYRSSKPRDPGAYYEFTWSQGDDSNE
ncbi:MAG: putative DNA binding domain-containing protein [Roseomonas sp.]|nr:putative DNA binding domain-containing protein [Roseomonas sp.]